jgi:AcrR family transcriptional regulator
MKKSDLTKRALLNAALEEFAEQGLSGARVERIAKSAGSNQAQIYHYFGSKEELFEATYLQLVLPAFTEIPLENFNLLTFIAEVFDVFQRNPRSARMYRWYQLQAAGFPQIDSAISASLNQVVSRIREAQSDGKIRLEGDPAEILTVALGMAEMAHSGLTDYRLSLGVDNERLRRAVLASAARALDLPPDTETDPTGPKTTQTHIGARP